jgi:hypothetical protein
MLFNPRLYFHIFVEFTLAHLVKLLEGVAFVDLFTFLER